MVLPATPPMTDVPRDLRITRAVSFDLVSMRPKMIGKNAQRDVHGDRAMDRMVRLYTNTGLEGIGSCGAGRDALAQLLGRNPFEFYRPEEKRMIGPLGSGTMPLWDLVGKALGKPVYELLGGTGPERVAVYDGSIYFSDLLPEYSHRPLDRFKEEHDMGLARGHRAFKVKIGRGLKWMPPEQGYARDVEVLKSIRDHVGRDVVIGVDANNGYDLQRAERLLEELPDYRFAFVEEMFPEDVQQCLALKAFIKQNGWRTLIADGESQGRLDAYEPFVAAKAIDLLQGDMNHFGIEGILAEAAMAEPQGLQIAPHNWGSLTGYYMQLHVGRAITNFYRAEHEPLSNSVLVAEGYEIKDGSSSVPDTSGFGLRIHEANFAGAARVNFDIKF